MIKHKFFLLEKEKLNTNQWFLKIEESIKKTVIIQDDIIINNPLFFKGFNTFKVSLNNPGEGLDYHGITIIPPKSLPFFIKNLIKLKVEKKQ